MTMIANDFRPVPSATPPVRGRVTRALRAIGLVTALCSAVPVSQAQTAALPTETVVNADLVFFQCQPSFTGHGIGVCSGRIDAALRNVVRPIKAADFRCEVLVRYWWREGRETHAELKSLELTASTTRLGQRFADVSIEFETDLTSVVHEPLGAYVQRRQCEVEYRN